MTGKFRRTWPIILAILVGIAGCANQAPTEAETPAEANEEPATNTTSPPGDAPPAPIIPEAHLRMEGCQGARLLSDWAPDTLPWGFAAEWEVPFGATSLVLFVALHCERAEVGGIWSFQNVSFVWERHTNISGGPELDNRAYDQLSATLDFYAEPSDFRARLEEIGIDARAAGVDADRTNLEVTAENDNGEVHVEFSPVGYRPDGASGRVMELITVLHLEPVVVLAGTAQYWYGHGGSVPDVEATGSFHASELARDWGAPILWTGSFINDAAIDMSLERFQ